MPTAPVFPLRNIRPARALLPVGLLPQAMPATSVSADLVFEGGAALGAAYAGSLNFLAQQGIGVARVAGNSAGAITAALVAAGFSAAELEWLMSNFQNRRLARPASLPAGLAAIDFMDFLDLPRLGDISGAERRQTLLWKALSGEAIDALLAQRVPGLPTRSKAKEDIVDRLKGLPVLGGLVNGATEATLRDALDPLLGFLPRHAPTFADYSAFAATQALRAGFADAAWNTVALNNPLLLALTQLVHGGGLFVGQAFCDIFARLLGAKLKGNAQATVQFKELKIPLAVIACDYASGSMQVYDSRRTPDMLVVEAVRRSMSIPAVFEPRGDTGRPRTIVDGGLCANFPVWLFSAAGDAHWPAASIDAARPKIGFSLDERRAAPPAWQAAPAKFPTSGAPPHVPPLDVLVAMLVSRLKELGLFVARPGYADADLVADIKGWKLLEVLAGSLGVDKELAARTETLAGLMAGRPFFDVQIPLLGFSGLDFSVNSERGDLDAMAERAFLATRDALCQATAAGTPALRPQAAALASPY